MNSYRRGRASVLAVTAVAAVAALIVGFTAFMSGASASPRASAALIVADTTAMDTTAPTTNPTSSSTANPPVANSESFTIWPVHKYNETTAVLKNDDPEGCSALQIVSVSQTGSTTTARVTLSKTHQLMVRSFTRTSKPRSITFTYVAECVDNGLLSSPVTDTVTLHPMFFLKVKLLSGHRMKFINRNTTYLEVKDFAKGGKLLLHTPFRLSPVGTRHATRIVKRPHVRNMWEGHVGVYRIPAGFGFVQPW